MATHSSVLAWRIPGIGEPGGLLSMGTHRVRHNWSDLAAAAVAAGKRGCPGLEVVRKLVDSTIGYLFFFFFFRFYFFGCAALAWRILGPQPGTWLIPPAVEAQSLNLWTAREVPTFSVLNHSGTLVNKNEARLTLWLVKEQQPLIWARTGGYLLIFMAWTISCFCLCLDVTTARSCSWSI